MKNMLKLLLCALALSAMSAVSAQEPPAAPVVIELPEVAIGIRERDVGSVVAVGRDAQLRSDGKSGVVVSVFGSATSEGEVAESVVSIVGNTRVTGPAGDSAVAVLGNTYVNSHIGGDAVAIFGDVELGPAAVVDGDVVVVGGALKRDPLAQLAGDVNNVLMGAAGGNFDGLRTWMRECALYGRPLAFVRGIGWAWGTALAFLAIYLVIAMAFRRGVERCVATLRTRPGQSVVAALLTLLLTPVLLLILVASVVGLLALPFATLALFCAALLGKAVMLAWIGGGCIALVRPRDQSGTGSVLAHPALAVLVGGAIALLLYTVPVLGIIVYKLLGVLGLGAVVFTVILAMRGARDARRAAASSQAVAQVSMTAAAELPAAATPSPLPTTLALPRAGFWIRIAALAIDALLMLVVVSLIYSSMRLTLLSLAVYGAVMWKLRGTTIGGSILGLKLVRTDGREIDWTTAVVRMLSCFVSLIPLGLGFVWIAFDDERQAWHDRIVGTVVVRSPRGVPLL